MADNLIDRGGEVGADTVPPSEQSSPIARSGGWGNIAFLGAGLALIGTMGGIAIGYGAFHHSGSAKPAEQPAKASDRAVADVMGSPNAQRAQLAGQLGQPNAPQTDMFGRPIAATPNQATDANGNPAPVSANGQETPEQKRAEQARSMADAARRSPIMAFGSTGIASAGSPGTSLVSAEQPQGNGQPQGDGQGQGRGQRLRAE